jgi:hypothetical protein
MKLKLPNFLVKFHQSRWSLPIDQVILTLSLLLLTHILQQHLFILSCFILGVFTITNYVFFKEIQAFMTNKHGENNLLADFVALTASGIANIFIFSTIYFTWGIIGEIGLTSEGAKQELIINDYILSIYFSIVTWTTLGYGDFKPPADLRLIASLQALMGYLYMAIVVGIFLSLFKPNSK